MNFGVELNSEVCTSLKVEFSLFFVSMVEGSRSLFKLSVEHFSCNNLEIYMMLMDRKILTNDINGFIIVHFEIGVI